MFWTELKRQVDVYLIQKIKEKHYAFVLYRKKLLLTETFAVWLNREILAFRGWPIFEHFADVHLRGLPFHMAFKTSKKKKIIEENKIIIFCRHKLSRMSCFEKLCGHKLSWKGPKTTKS